MAQYLIFLAETQEELREMRQMTKEDLENYDMRINANSLADAAEKAAERFDKMNDSREMYNEYYMFVVGQLGEHQGFIAPRRHDMLVC